MAKHISRARAATAVAASFAVVLAALALARVLPTVILAAYLILSALSFGAYAIDKSAARRGSWRTPESTLHLLAVAGGWPGALVAQQVLHHKTVKQPFRRVFWVSVVMNCVLLAAFIIIRSGYALGEPWLR